MTNLGGHDLATILEAFESIDHDRPVCFIAYTVKGYGRSEEHTSELQSH